MTRSCYKKLYQSIEDYIKHLEQGNTLFVKWDKRNFILINKEYSHIFSINNLSNNPECFIPVTFDTKTNEITEIIE